MEKFNKALIESIASWSKLSEEWEKIEATHSDIISKNYPFTKDFREILNDLIEWKESIEEEN
jgi:predicted ATP-binding protein involved in virulence